MNYDFDEIHKRDHTLSVKWNPELYSDRFNGHKDLLPLWVADMDFTVSKGITDRFARLNAEGIFGYSQCDGEYYEAIITWNKRRYGIALRKEEIVYTPGVVPALNYIIQTFTCENDAVLIQPPVYYPFKQAVINNNRRLINSPLLESAPCYYTMDYAGLEKKIVENNVRLFIFCNPHNPVGRVWTKDELQKMADICLKHNVLIVSDEIHCDLIFFGNRFTPLMSLSEKVANMTITCNAVSKTFNLAGLQVSSIIIKNTEIRDEYRAIMQRNSLTQPSIFAVEAVKGAYCDSDDWYEQMLRYIEGTIVFASEYIARHIPQLSMKKQEGTYLGWIDARKLGLTREKLIELCEIQAKVAFDYGYWFGDEGNGFIRINLACPRSVVERALKQLGNAVALLK